MSCEQREQYWIDLEDEILQGGAAFSEWCTYISKDVYIAFVNGANLSTIVMALACIETYLKTENFERKRQPLSKMIDDEEALCDEEKQSLHELRKYRNKWVHMYNADDRDILDNERQITDEAEKMAFLAVKILLTVLFSNQFV